MFCENTKPAMIGWLLARHGACSEYAKPSSAEPARVMLTTPASSA
jgi:hypothetical protein